MFLWNIFIDIYFNITFWDDKSDIFYGFDFDFVFYIMSKVLKINNHFHNLSFISL